MRVVVAAAGGAFRPAVLALVDGGEVSAVLVDLHVMELAVEETLKTLKEGEAGDFNQALIETGAIVCVPNGAPLCGAPCPFYTVCEARKKALSAAAPGGF